MSRTISIHQNLKTHVLALSISCLLLIGCRRPCGGSHTIKHTIWWLQFILIGSLPNCTTHDPITHHFKLTHGQPKNQTKPNQPQPPSQRQWEWRKGKKDETIGILVGLSVILTTAVAIESVVSMKMALGFLFALA